MPGFGRRLPRSFYRRDALDVAPELLNKLLVLAGDGSRGTARRVGRIVEVEAYRGGDDPGSHAYRGRTNRNATMFGPAGHLYVYFTYGMHHCANVVCGDDGVASAVLLRALTPLVGLEEMRRARGTRAGGRRPLAPGSDRDLCRGPARLCQALGLARAFDGADLVAGDRGVIISDDGMLPPHPPGVSARIGLAKGRGELLPWRFFVLGAAELSRPGPQMSDTVPGDGQADG